MARSTEEIQGAMKAHLKDIDNRLDTEVGPLWDYVLSPNPQQFALVEEDVDTVKKYYSPNFAAVATTREVRNFAVNFGTGPGPGSLAIATVVFFRNSAPPAGQLYVVPIGTLVMTRDSNLRFKTRLEVSMNGDYASTYYNPTTQRYEISVLVEATAPGVKYNLPLNHLVKMQPISGIDGVRQASDGAGGTEPEDPYSVVYRVQTKFQGLEKYSLGGMETYIMEYEPSLVLAVHVIRPTDRREFRRQTNGPSLDICIDGEQPSIFNEEFLAVGDETTVPITANQSVTGVSSVTVNGNVVPVAEWTFVPDSTLEYQHSTRANASVQFLTPLLINDLVEITGVRNYLLDRVQYLFLGEDQLFETDILIRAFEELPIVVGLDVRINDGDPDEIHGQILAWLTYFIEGEISESLSAGSMKSGLRDAIPEIISINVLEFARKSGSMAMVELIVPYKNERPIFDSVASSITVRS